MQELLMSFPELVVAPGAWQGKSKSFCEPRATHLYYGIIGFRLTKQYCPLLGKFMSTTVILKHRGCNVRIRSSPLCAELCSIGKDRLFDGTLHRTGRDLPA